MKVLWGISQKTRFIRTPANLYAPTVVDAKLHVRHYVSSGGYERWSWSIMLLVKLKMKLRLFAPGSGIADVEKR